MKFQSSDKRKKSIIQYAVFGVIVLVLYITGLHTEVIAFAQRGLLATGIMNPDVSQISNASANDENSLTSKLEKADLNFQIMDRNGKVFSMEELKGKVIFMNFWATWCPPCIAEMPGINKLYNEMGEEVVFIMLSLDQDFEVAKAFEQRKQYDFPIYSPVSNMPEMYNSRTIPTTYIIDAEGNLALTHKGMANYNASKFKKFLRSLK